MQLARVPYALECTLSVTLYFGKRRFRHKKVGHMSHYLGSFRHFEIQNGRYLKALKCLFLRISICNTCFDRFSRSMSSFLILSSSIFLNDGE